MIPFETRLLMCTYPSFCFILVCMLIKLCHVCIPTTCCNVILQTSSCALWFFEWEVALFPWHHRANNDSIRFIRSLFLVFYLFILLSVCISLQCPVAPFEYISTNIYAVYDSIHIYINIRRCGINQFQ